MKGTTRKNSRRKKLNQSKRGGANLKDIWLSRVWQSQTHQASRLKHYIRLGDLEKVKIYVNRVKIWSHQLRWSGYPVLYEALVLACEQADNPRKHSADIIYYLLDNIDRKNGSSVDVMEKDYGVYRNDETPLRFAIRTKNLEMIDKLFQTKWKDYRAYMIRNNTRIASEIGNIEVYKKISTYPIYIATGHRGWNDTIRIQIENEQERGLRLRQDKATALTYGHRELAGLIQSMIDGTGIAEPEMLAPPVAPM